MKGFREGEIKKIIQINTDKCKGCNSCQTFCPNEAIDGKYGAKHSIDDHKCTFCGQCLINCPFGAIEDVVDPVDLVIEKLRNKNTTVVASTAPSVRVALGEEFGMKPGELVTEKMYGALKQAGFKMIDTNFGADNTIMEEAYELVAKIRHYILNEPTEHHLGMLPQFTSCCPAWVRYAELNYPKILPHLSTAKSPIAMAAPAAKVYGARDIWHVDPENIFVVAIMPCTAKKFELKRPEFHSAANYWKKQGRSGDYPDVDATLTTRDLARLLKKLNIDFNHVPEFEDQDNPLAKYSGGGTIFGITGGVMESALRTAYFAITGKELENLELKPIRGLNGVKSIELTMKDKKTGKDITLNFAVVNGIKDNVRPIIEDVIAGKSPYHFIEVMNCPGGCLNGGGQPINPMGTSWLGKYKAILPW